MEFNTIKLHRFGTYPFFRSDIFRAWRFHETTSINTKEMNDIHWWRFSVLWIVYTANIADKKMLKQNMCQHVCWWLEDGETMRRKTEYARTRVCVVVYVCVYVCMWERKRTERERNHPHTHTHTVLLLGKSISEPTGGARNFCRFAGRAHNPRVTIYGNSSSYGEKTHASAALFEGEKMKPTFS